MKERAPIETAVRLFPDKEFETATIRTTIMGHVISRMLKKGIDPYRSCVETGGKALEKGKKLTVFQLEFQ